MNCHIDFVNPVMYVERISIHQETHEITDKPSLSMLHPFLEFLKTRVLDTH